MKMKLLKFILLAMLLFCGTLLFATTNNKLASKFKNAMEKTSKPAMEDLEFIPGTVLL